MEARKFIVQIKYLIEDEFGYIKGKKGQFSRSDFENPEFKITVLERAKIVFLRVTVSPEQMENYYTIALNEFRVDNATDIEPSISLNKTSGNEWLTEQRQTSIGWNDNGEIKTYRERYFRYLSKIGRSDKYIEETRRSSLSIVGKIGDPKSSQPFYRKGMVVGAVQSGKTANFNAVINSAVDAGYGLIIVLSGIMEDLRKQTQKRIENDIAGYSSQAGGFIGVGQIAKFGQQGDYDIPQVQIPTSLNSDFNKNIKEADFSLNFQNILICKKNTGVLKNLILWLNEYLRNNEEKHDIPLLIIDDEADNASLNNLGIKGKEYATTINGHIRALLELFRKKTYLGYTATPFANILQDRNDTPSTSWSITEKKKGKLIEHEFGMVDNLFPDDFIELLFPPSNYIGAKHFFETRLNEVAKIESLVVPILDTENAFPTKVVVTDSGEVVPAVAFEGKRRSSIKDDPFPQYIPESLKEAILCFILTIAVRLDRKPNAHQSVFFNPHQTMLIHISRFVDWQNRTKNLVQKYLEDIMAGLANDLPSDQDSVYGLFEKTWNKYYSHVIGQIHSYLPPDYDDPLLDTKSFGKDIKPLLFEASSGIEVLAINGKTRDSLDYNNKNGNKYIAIGGNRLSRGFTLEGLTINYFSRKTNYADTLLQMGRWFGYRPGYLDCCKLFTPPHNIEKFDQTTVTIEELEEEFKTMNRKKRTPSDFTLWVMSNPKVVRVTRDSFTKGTKKRKIQFSSSLEQSTIFDISPEIVQESWDAFRTHVGKLEWETEDEFFIHTTDSEGLKKFLNLRNTFRNMELNGLPKYLELCNSKGKLTRWTIAVKRTGSAAGEGGILYKENSNLPENLNLAIRRASTSGGNSPVEMLKRKVFRASGKSSNLVTRGADFSITLSGEQKNRAENEFREEKLSQYLNDPKYTREEAVQRARKVNIPDKVYRKAMDESDGILVIYLFSTAHIFDNITEQMDSELTRLKDELGDTPLYGYALGFPAINGNIGADYITRHEQSEGESYDEAEENEDYNDYSEILDTAEQ
ncbi:MAG: Z1 domain-containing protein [Bacteroidia bacterium]|nr:Z1 domain-containing protein [Bacteroidia bacterium]